MSDLLVSIDLGTTRLKVAAYRTDGTLAHQVLRRHEEVRDRPVGGSGLETPGARRRWQRAQGWWEDTVEAVRELCTRLGDARVLGIGLSGRGGAAVFTDADGEVVADPWSDNRHVAQAERLAGWRRSGAWLSNYGLQLIAKYLWLREEHPVAASAIRHAFYGKDWLLYRLTGAHVTDWTSGPDRSTWDPALARWSLPDGLLPTPALPWASAGTLTESAARALGLSAGLPVAVGAHDGLAANIGAGAIRAGDCAITLGTHAVVRMVMQEVPSGAYRFYGFPPDRHVVGGNAVLAGRSADWLLELTAPVLPTDDRTSAYEVLEAQAGAVAPGADGVRFLPFLAGRLSPELRPGARALFAGLSLTHGRGELYRAVLEGAAFAVADIFDQVSAWCGPPRLLRATGGGADSALWMEILASILGRPVGLCGPGVEGRGAAMCLSVALGMHEDLETASDAMVCLEGEARPNVAWGDAYRAVRADWQTLNALSRQLDAPQ
ncbi:MAG: FGGY-family carbohydrate kinase [Pseudomonadales bacterium]|jgi:xylulokinase